MRTPQRPTGQLVARSVASVAASVTVSVAASVTISVAVSLSGFGERWAWGGVICGARLDL